MKQTLVAAFLLVFTPLLALADSIKISDIRVEGLQRVSAGSVFAALPVNVGDSITQLDVGRSIRALFSTGYFENINIGHDGTVLVIAVEERPSISEIVLDGNKAIESEQLLKGLKDAGLAEGQVFRRATLEGVRLELQRQYVSQGRYGASVKTIVEELPRNRVALKIEIVEGGVAAIKHINIVGNTVFEQEALIDLFELKSSTTFSWLTGNDKYAKEKLSGDLERLKSYYLDRGYLKFNIDSTQVSISPDKETVFISVNITEGEKYFVGEVKLAGELILEEKELMRLVLVKEKQAFSQVLMTTTSDYLTQRLGNAGYTFSKVRGIPEIDDETKKVKVTFFVEPGNRSYVRRINFRGNVKTTDEVLRREMRQMEGAVASTSKIEQSKIRLSRLGFFKEVNVSTPTVPGTSDQIDVEYQVEEQSSGSIGASLGFAQGSGVVLGANIQQKNFLGSGKRVGFSINTSEYQKQYSFNYHDPYYTADGVSRGFSVFFRTTDFDSLNLTNYRTDSFGAAINFGYPISEIERLGFSFGFTDTKIHAGGRAVQEIFRSPRIDEKNVDFIIDVDDFNSVYGAPNFVDGILPDDVADDQLSQAEYISKYTDYHALRSLEGVDESLDEDGEKIVPAVVDIDNSHQGIIDENAAIIAKNNSDNDETNDEPTVNVPTEDPGNDGDEFSNVSFDLEEQLKALSEAPELNTSTPEGFLDIYGDHYQNFSITSTWSRSTLNRGRLATRGSSQSLSFELTVPGSDLEYFKFTYNGQYFRPLTKSLTLRLRTRLGFGDGYGTTDTLPFFEHFFSGGFGSVRGFKRNTLGPRSTSAVSYAREVICKSTTVNQHASVSNTLSTCADDDVAVVYLLQPGDPNDLSDDKLISFLEDDDQDPFGGDVIIEGSAEIIFPLPFVKDQRSMQTALFFDAGNSFSSHCSSSQVNCFDVDFGELRYSVGIGLQWITGFGPLTFSLAKALNASSDDDTEVFQFSLGQGF